MAVSSSAWDKYARLVEELARTRTEGPLFDRKQELYSVEPTQKGKLIRHFIALANAARRRGEHALLVFGADDEAWTVIGLDRQHIFPGRPGVTLAEIECEPGRLEKWHDEIENNYRQTLEAWIEPKEIPAFQFECGPLEGKLIGCLVIPPEPTEMPYRVRQVVNKDQKRKLKEMELHPGDCWRRVGANSEKVPPDSPVMRHSWRTLPFIPKEGWLAYLRDIASSFCYRLEEEVDRYQPLQVRKGESFEDLAELLWTFAHGGGKRPAVLLLVGPPGSGKTTALRRLAYDLAEAALVELERPPAEYVAGRFRALDQPTEIIPVFISLRRFDTSRQQITQRFVEALTAHGGSLMRLDQSNLDCNPVDVLTDREISFLVILDGLDEMAQWEAGIQAIESFLCQYPGARFIVSSRSAYQPRWCTERIPHDTAFIEPFALQHQVRLYLDRSPWLEWLERNSLMQHLEVLLTNPRKLAALDGQSPPAPEKGNLGMALDALLGGFLDEEQARSSEHRASVLREQWEQSLQSLAYQMCKEGKKWLGKRRANECMGNENLRLWGEEVGLLHRSGNRIAFVADVVRAYYAACEINRMLEDEEDITSLLVAERLDYWQDPIHIAANLWPDDLTDGIFAQLLEAILDTSPLLVAQCLSERQEQGGGVALLERVCRKLAAHTPVALSGQEAIKRFLLDPNPQFRRTTISVLIELGVDCLNPTLEEIAEQTTDLAELEHIVVALEKLHSPRAAEFRAELENRIAEPSETAQEEDSKGPDGEIPEDEAKSTTILAHKEASDERSETANGNAHPG